MDRSSKILLVDEGGDAIIPGNPLPVVEEGSATEEKQDDIIKELQDIELDIESLVNGKYITQIDNGDTTENIVYVGLAVPTTATSAASWQIQKIDKTTSNITVLYADGDTSFNNIYDNRASLSYS